MLTDLQHDLTACIRDALRLQAYSPPRTPNTNITDLFYNQAAAAILDRLRAAGWKLLPAATKWRDVGQGGDLGVSDQTSADLEREMQQGICIALKIYKPRPPRSSDPQAMEQYQQRVAEHVVSNVLQSNWELDRVLQKIAPAPRHSTPPH
jgi:hypothetical protein